MALFCKEKQDSFFKGFRHRGKYVDGFFGISAIIVAGLTRVSIRGLNCRILFPDFMHDKHSESPSGRYKMKCPAEHAALLERTYAKFTSHPEKLHLVADADLVIDIVLVGFHGAFRYTKGFRDRGVGHS